jgi:hypothetical protein
MVTGHGVGIVEDSTAEECARALVQLFKEGGGRNASETVGRSGEFDKGR